MIAILEVMRCLLCASGQHHWKLDHAAGNNNYYTCPCGARSVVRLGCYSPIDQQWLDTGRRSETAPSCVPLLISALVPPMEIDKKR